MEKVIYTLWRPADSDAESFGQQLREQLAPQLLAMGNVRGLQFNLDDAAVKPAAGVRQLHLKPAIDALLQVWLDSAISAYRAPVDAAIAAVASRYDAYLVTESQPVRNTRHPPAAGARTFGFAQIALLSRPAALPYQSWLDIWHNSHTAIAIETQSTFEYIQNVVVRALTPGARPYDAIVEECFPPEAMSDYPTFFDAPGDEAKFRRNLQRMMESVSRFIEAGKLDVLPTSQYRFKAPA